MPVRKKTPRIAAKVQRTEPLVVTEFKRLGKKFGEGEYAEGFFERDPYFRFEAYLDDVLGKKRDVPGRNGFEGTRVTEFYFRCEGDNFHQYSWFEGRPKPDWKFGRLLLADFLAGLEPAIKTHTADNNDYCESVIKGVVGRLKDAGIKPSFIATSLSKALTSLK